MVNPNHLSDHQIAIAFGDTLSLIYKNKVEEINEELAPVYAHLDALDTPKYNDFEKSFARRTLPPRARMLMQSIDHINKIRNIYRKVKKMPPEAKTLDVEGARRVPIETLYAFRRKGNLVSCPFHGEDKDPSMSLKNNRFHCFACGASGDTIAFVMRMNGYNFRQAVEALTCQK